MQNHGEDLGKRKEREGEKKGEKNISSIYLWLQSFLENTSVKNGSRIDLRTS